MYIYVPINSQEGVIIQCATGICLGNVGYAYSIISNNIAQSYDYRSRGICHSSSMNMGGVDTACGGTYQFQSH